MQMSVLGGQSCPRSGEFSCLFPNGLQPVGYGSGQANKVQSGQRVKDCQRVSRGTRKFRTTFQPCTAMRLIARNVHAAEDLVHDTVVKAYSCIDKFLPGSNLRAWLFTILRNTFYSGMRKQKREVADPDGLYAARLVTQSEHDGRLTMGEFLNALDPLSSEHRDIVTLVGVTGHSFRVTSRMIGIPVGTAKSRLSRARAQLTERLYATARPVPRCDRPMPVMWKAPQDGRWSFH